MKNLIILNGSHQSVKRRLLTYCFENFEKENIWVIDSLQIFDPYFLSRIDVVQARKMLSSVVISRPFTFYQLKNKVYSLTKINSFNRTVIITGLDAFDDESINPLEKSAHLEAIFWVLNRLNCKVIVGVSDFGKYEVFFKGVSLWEEQLSQSGMKLNRSLKS